MACNKVIYDGRTLIDLTKDTVSSGKLLNGTTAHASDGSSIVGTAEAAVTNGVLHLPSGLIPTVETT